MLVLVLALVMVLWFSSKSLFGYDLWRQDYDRGICSKDHFHFSNSNSSGISGNGDSTRTGPEGVGAKSTTRSKLPLPPKQVYGVCIGSASGGIHTYMVYV